MLRLVKEGYSDEIGAVTSDAAMFTKLVILLRLLQCNFAVHLIIYLNQHIVQVNKPLRGVAGYLLTEPYMFLILGGYIVCWNRGMNL